MMLGLEKYMYCDSQRTERTIAPTFTGVLGHRALWITLAFGPH